MSWESPNIFPLPEPEALPKELPVQKSEGAEALFSKEIETWVVEKIEPVVDEIEMLEEKYTRLAEGISSEKFKIDFGKLKEKLRVLTKKIKKVAPLLLSMTFMVGLEDTNSVSSKEAFAEKGHAAVELSENGITQAQMTAYRPGVSEFLYQAVPPYYYRGIWQVIKAIPANLVDSDDRGVVIRTIGTDFTMEVNRGINPEREDAWRLYLGLSQKNDTFDISEYQPPLSSEDNYYYKINDWLNKYNPDFPGEDTPTTIESKIKLIIKGVSTNFGFIENKNQNDSEAVGVSPFDTDSVAAAEEYGGKRPRFGIMGNFTLSLGSDERGKYISYNDVWDLGGSDVEGERGLFGKPLKIYDRIYYDPETFKPIV